ncbi:hypothetical protein AgCh_039796 [Apium graveolens]
MEANKAIVPVNDFDLPTEGSDDDLSLRNLQITTNSNPSSPRTSSVSAPDIFEFFSSIVSGDEASQANKDIIFCGKLIPYNNETKIISSSARSFNYLIDNEEDRFSRGNRSENLQARSEYSVHKVNITSLTTMSPKARRRMFMFGPVKFKPEMELSAIRERQSRRAPALMFPIKEEKLEVGPVKSKVHLTDILAKSLCYR